MSEVKVGDVRLTETGIAYVITRTSFNKADAVHEYGGVYWCFDKDCFEKDKLLAHYDTFQEAIISKEFNECHI